MFFFWLLLLWPSFWLLGHIISMIIQWYSKECLICTAPDLKLNSGTPSSFVQYSPLSFWLQFLNPLISLENEIQIHGRRLAISFSENKSICSCCFVHGLQAHVYQISLIIFLYSNFYLSQIADVHILYKPIAGFLYPQHNFIFYQWRKGMWVPFCGRVFSVCFSERSSSEICLIWTVVTNNLPKLSNSK